MYVLDIETVPAARELIEAKMPEEIRNPVVPDELINPVKPDFAEKCPKYASAKDSEEKRAAWMEAAERKWTAKLDSDRAKWKEKTEAAKLAFFNGAALDARLGHAKLIGLRDTDAEIDRIWIWEKDAEQAARIMAWYRRHEETHIGRVYKGRSLWISILPTEAGMLQAFMKKFEEVMQPSFAHEDVIQGGKKVEKWTAIHPKCVTYFGHHFDFPFLYRRSWILGVPHQPFFMRGRFYEPYMIDLCDVWQFWDRSESMGGLDGLSTTLGLPGKSGKDAASFHEWYAQDPTEGIAYLIGDLDATHGSAERMGIIRPKRENDPLP